MTARNPWQSYRKVVAHTASPAQLVLMLYEGGISFLERAMAGFEESDPGRFNLTINNNILKAQAIVHELNSRLDMEHGGDISANFRRLYNYLYRRLQEANLKKKREPIQEVIMRLKVLRDSWAEMLQRGINPEQAAENSQESALQAA